MADKKPPPLLFIDANIYLKFYEARRDHLRTLLGSLKEAEAFVLVTKQIVYEVRRNQRNVFARQVDQILGEISEKIGLASFHPKADSKARSNWNKRIATTETKLKAIKRAYQNDAEKMAEKIRTSIDPVSTALSGIFSTAIEASTTEFDMARLRRERGNPPGKRSDPLGDQLSWEQLLGKAKPNQAIWIVAEDGDYWEANSKKTSLRSLLYSELREKIGKGGAIHCFTRIGDALPHFSREGIQLKKLPTAGEQRKIAAETHAIEEPRLGLSAVGLTSADILRGLGYNPENISRLGFTPANFASLDLKPIFSTTPAPFDFAFNSILGGNCPKCGSPPITTGATLAVGNRTGRVYNCIHGHAWS